MSLFLADFAEPPAESPSTIKISHSLAFLLEQSANLPGNFKPSKADFLLVKSLAFLAAALALWANIAFSQIILAILGFCSKK